MSRDGKVRWGAHTNVGLRLQFPHSKYDRISLGTTPVEILHGSEKLAHASGFFWRTATGVWLITNWHCVTGNNPFTNRVLVQDRPPPSHIRYFPLHTNTTPDGALHFPRRIPIERELFENEIPVWQQHREFANLRTDVVSIRISVRADDPAQCINEYEPVTLHHHVGADLFVVGYPLDNYDGWMPPYWKRGSFAGEPILPMDNKPLFPIDVLSTEGMSGSPVFRRVFGPRASPDASTTALDNIVATEFVGVYAGRLANKDLDRVGIGYGWYGYLVDEIINAGVPGTTC